MTDAKIQELVNRVRLRGLLEEDAGAILEALSDLARIKGAALPHEIARIERLHHADLTRLGIDAGHPGAGKEADEHRATLLDALRVATLDAKLGDVALREAERLKEERDEAREALAVAVYERDCDRERYVGQIAALRQQLAQARKEIERLQELGKLGSCVYCGYIGPKESFAHHITECLEHPLGDAKDPKMYALRFFDLVQQVRRYQQEAMAIICRACNYEDAIGQALAEQAVAKEQLSQAERDKAAIAHVAAKQIMARLQEWNYIDDRDDRDGVQAEISRIIGDLCKPHDGEAEKGQESKAEPTIEQRIAEASQRVDALKRERWAARGQDRFDYIDEQFESAKEDLQELLDEQAEVLAAHRDVKPGNILQTEEFHSIELSGRGEVGILSRDVKTGNSPRACGICERTDIPRGVDWPWWIDGKPVHAACLRPKPEKPENS